VQSSFKELMLQALCACNISSLSPFVRLAGEQPAPITQMGCSRCIAKMSHRLRRYDIGNTLPDFNSVRLERNKGTQFLAPLILIDFLRKLDY
jgi:hypothetical protein